MVKKKKAELPKDDTTNPYQFVGLKADKPGFADFVCSPSELNGKTFQAIAAYPKGVSEGLDASEMSFSSEGKTTTLKAENTGQHKVHDLTSFFAWAVLPHHYTATDEFVEDDKVGPHTFSISTQSLKNHSRGPISFFKEKLAEKMLGVKNRPGVIIKLDEGIYIFAPDKVGGLFHKPVKNGEFFVLLEQGVTLSDDNKQKVMTFYDNYVEKSYGDNNGVYGLETDSQIQAPK